MADWYYIGHYGQLGPLTLEQMEELIQGGVIVRETYVWATGMASWLPAEQVSDLKKGFLIGAALAPPPPPPAMGPAAPAPAYQPYGSDPASFSGPRYPMPLAGRGYPAIKSDRSRVAGGVLNLLIPGIGRMYLGYAAIGVLQLVATICSFGVLWLWPFVDGILILSGAVKVDGYGRTLGD